QAREKTVQLNEPLINEYLKASKKAAAKFKLKGELSVESLLRMPDVLQVVEEERQEQDQKKAVVEAVQEALRALEKMRQSEGARLGKDMLDKAKDISQVVQQIRHRHKMVVADKVKAFREKISEFVPEPLIDQMRLATEESVTIQ